MNHLMTTIEETMSSLQIAELTGKNHAHVMRDIRNMVEKINESSRGLVKEESKNAREKARKEGKYKGISSNVVDSLIDIFNKECSLQGYTITQESYIDSKGESRSMYVLNKKASLLLASSYNHLLRMKIIDRWEQLEKERLANQPQVPQSFAQALLLAAQQQAKIEEQQKMLEVKNEQVSTLTNKVAEMQEKVSYLDTILQCKSTVLVTQIAQDYGMSAKNFNRILADTLHIQHKVNKQWILYAKFISCGYVHSKPIKITRSNGAEEIKYNTEWTQKGRLFLYNELKNHGILPLIEKL